ncbi:MAG: HAD-IA family hydrolase [Clostridia bacterium]|nr:HAD-IA family hydrolase [Clostridia bacterium]
MKISAVLFDFDGTLLDSSEMILNSWQHAFRTITGSEGDEAMILSSYGEPLEATMKKFFPNEPLHECVEIYRDYQRGRFLDMIKIFPNTIELLENLRKRRLHLAIVTSRITRTTHLALGKFDMEKYFEKVVTCDDTDKHKPDPEPARIALEALGVAADEVVMIGDSIFDMGCGRNAGTTTVLADWDHIVSDEDKKGEYAPDFVISEPLELLKVLDALEAEK